MIPKLDSSPPQNTAPSDRYIQIRRGPLDCAREKPVSPETILLVEDEPAIRRLMALALTRAGYSVLEAPNGHEALGIFREQAGTIDLAIVDMRLPAIGGRELIERLREQQPALKVVAISGYPPDTPLNRSAFLAKPFLKEDLLQTVRAILDAPQ
jgi:two-component system cell cycle sensor histidine kinase/response regulator CckA